jgi:twitching motility protein PilT
MTINPWESNVPVTPREEAAIRIMRELVDLCIKHKASDVHLVVGLPPYLRMDGILEPQPDHGPISLETMQLLADELLAAYDKTPFEKTGAQDGALTGPDGSRFRFNIFRTQGRPAIALRKLDDTFRTLAELGLPESLYQLGNLSDGLVLICGPTGAGKSTTLATLLDRINQTRRCHIVTIEDPIEYVHEPAMGLVNQRQVGRDASSFNDALVASLRQDPDVILVGEIRDLPTIRTAITAAETGHLVFTTVHAGDCVGAIERLVSVFSAEEQGGIRRQLALVLRAVVTQHLLVADGTAGAPATAGRRPRVAVSEMLMITPAVANLIATAKSNQIYSSIETGTGQGMHTLEQDLARLWAANVISETTATALARNPAILRDRVAMLRKPTLRTVGGGR